ncbi:hypothetical protein Q7267_08805 [Glaesserella parasuis]|uniref:hypothetical protein n=1 Tax=Glaesserella parasuis TaxID=738 RepID=UPI002436B66B|nr:hypothetical protein [Glaesserella parasuis]MDG6269513.1 hypothetical protein [Glaesserella parasuis]MDO9950492.1 hypothetical protein [Glaesserella parasuis]MDP0020736.1 hypothetical protein [Glaesserella parasuis]MDP0060888.1 hypothetical protein [Glaesserella parasuis]MDP0063251.1 hypothetical protein [Glaesserella parasuis]
MPIKFPSLLQDSWNFIRNQGSFTLTGTALLILLQLSTIFLFPRVEIQAGNTSNQEMLTLLTSQLAPTIISALISVFINILLILNIKAINSGTYQHFSQNIGATLKAFFPVILLTIFMVMPLSIGISFGGTVGQQGSFAIMILPLMATGIYLFVKLSLVVYAYLLEAPQSIMQTLRFTWGLSRGRMFPLFLFCILSYFFPSLLGSLIGRIGGDVGIILSQVVGAFISLFVVVFGFRFYQVYRQ